MTSALINIDDELWHRIHIYKYKKKFRNMNDVVTHALKEMIEREGLDERQGQS